MDNPITSTIPVGQYPAYAALTPDGATLYVSNLVSDTVSVVSTGTNSVTTTISGFASPQGLTASSNGQELYVTDSSGVVYVVNTTSNTISGSPISTNGGPFLEILGCREPL